MSEETGQCLESIHKEALAESLLDDADKQTKDFFAHESLAELALSGVCHHIGDSEERLGSHVLPARLLSNLRYLLDSAVLEQGIEHIGWPCGDVGQRPQSVLGVKLVLSVVSVLLDVPVLPQVLETRLADREQVLLQVWQSIEGLQREVVVAEHKVACEEETCL